MSGKDFMKRFRFFRPRGTEADCLEEKISDGWAEKRCGQREWEHFYRDRWQYDKKVRSTHGVNCTGSCSWDVYVKNGIIVWETQATDYPACGEGFPNHEPRGCPRGSTFSWYTYSPVRIKYPLIRSSLLELWRNALTTHGDAVKAWRDIAGNPEKRSRYQHDRGKGGLVRLSWDEATTITAASLVHTIQRYGPDRIFGFTPIPAMSMVAYAAGTRFLSLIGGSAISFYDWYADLPPASPQIWGEQTDVPESADWYESTYMIVWGTNLPMTRTPDAHFFTEARYRGAKVTAVAPDYAEYVKFADSWLPARAGTDAALAMAMTHVIVKEFYIDTPTAYFIDYAKLFTDLPFAVVLQPAGETFVSGRFLTAADLRTEATNPRWKTVFFDETTASWVVPNGSIGFCWDEAAGHWNLHLQDSQNDAVVDPLLSYAGDADSWRTVTLPFFDDKGPASKNSRVPVKTIQTPAGDLFVTTVFDLMTAQLGIGRQEDDGRTQDASVQYPTGYDDPQPFTPAWQQAITGVPQQDVIRVAHEFAENADKTHGKSMIFLGAGSNHWYHSDMIYRAIVNLTTLCGCQGVNGGGWAHYVGQEKVRPQAGWSQLAFGLDWTRPPRQQNGTSFYYFATDQWRYDDLNAESLLWPMAGDGSPRHMADYNAVAVRLGWLPSYPQFNRNPLDICREAVEKGASTDKDIIAHAVEQLKNGSLRFVVEDPDHPDNFPRVFFLWRANLLGASSKGHEYFLKHLLGVDNAVQNAESELRPEEIILRDPAPEGKLDLLVTLELRMSTSAMYSDIVLPAAGWYEMHDLSTTDMHPFIHLFNPAVDPPWEAKTSWDQFSAIAEKFSELAAVHLGEMKDLAEAMPQIVWITRPDGWNIYFNQRWMDYTGQTLAESYGHGWNKPFHPDDQQRAWAAWQNAVNNSAEYSLKCRLRRADGIYTWWLVRGVPLLDAEGTILKWFGTCTDIDDIKRTEEALLEKERLLTESQRLGHIGSFLFDMTGLIQWSDELYRIYGVSPETFTPTVESLLSLIHPDDRPAMEDWIAACMAGEKPDALDFCINRPDGKVRFVKGWGEAVYDDENKLRYIAGMVQDITERKRAEEALQRYSAELEKKNRELQEALANVKQLSGMLPICASCKKVRDDEGYWSGVETYVSKHTDAVFSHDLCPECEKKANEELDELIRGNS